MRIEDLPPWAQAQAANQIMARQRRGSGRSRAPSPALPDDKTVGCVCIEACRIKSGQDIGRLEPKPAHMCILF